MFWGFQLLQTCIDATGVTQDSGMLFEMKPGDLILAEKKIWFIHSFQQAFISTFNFSYKTKDNPRPLKYRCAENCQLTNPRDVGKERIETFKNLSHVPQTLTVLKHQYISSLLLSCEFSRSNDCRDCRQLQWKWRHSVEYNNIHTAWSV